MNSVEACINGQILFITPYMTKLLVLSFHYPFHYPFLLFNTWRLNLYPFIYIQPDFEHCLPKGSSKITPYGPDPVALIDPNVCGRKKVTMSLTYMLAMNPLFFHVLNKVLDRNIFLRYQEMYWKYSQGGHFFIIYLSFLEHFCVFQCFLSGIKTGEFSPQSSA